MKCVYLLIMVMVAPLLSTAQSDGNNLVVVKTNMSATENYIYAGEKLIKAGYKVPKGKREPFLRYAKLRKQKYRYNYNSLRLESWVKPEIICEDNRIVIYGIHGRSPSFFKPLIYKDGDSFTIEAFNKLTAIAELFEGNIGFETDISKYPAETTANDDVYGKPLKKENKRSRNNAL